MRSLLIASAAVLGLSACTTTSIDQTVQKNLPALCRNATDAHTVFTAIAETGKIKQSVIAKEARAYASMQVICADPSSQTATSVLVQATVLLLTINDALDEANKAGG